MKGKKRKADGTAGSEDESEESEDESEAMTGRRAKAAALARRGGSNVEKRREVEGRKKTDKDFYREGRNKEGDGGKQWSR